MFHLKRVLPLLALVLAVPAVKAHANTYVVDSTASSNSGGCSVAGDCPLGAAITIANNNPGPDTITFKPGLTGIDLTAAPPSLTDSATTTITGPTSRISLTRSGASFRFLTVAPGAGLAVSNLNFNGGSVGGFGGAINNDGTTTVDNCTFTRNSAGSGGGAISNYSGDLTVTNCVFDGNSGFQGGAILSTNVNQESFDARVTATNCRFTGNLSSREGGAIYNEGTLDITLCTLQNNAADTEGGAIFNGHQLSVTDSTLDGNVSQSSGGAILTRTSGATIVRSTLSNNRSTTDGGAIFADASLVMLSNSTLSGNRADGDLGGGALYVGTNAVISSCTITSNTSSVGAVVSPGTDTETQNKITVDNSILSGNSGSDAVFRNGSANPFDSRGYNIVGTGSGVSGFTATGDQPNVTDPKLGALANNGGPTKTHALQVGSPALDAGQTQLTTDQRGTARPQGSADDIGAFEGLPLTVAVFLTPKNPITNDILRATVGANNPGGGTVSYSYVWRKNGVVIPNETSSTLQLAKPGNGDKGDVISVEVSANNGQGASGSATASVTVINSAPVTFSGVVNAQAGVETVFAFRGNDLDGDPLTFERAGGPVNGTAEIRVDPADGVSKIYYTSRARYGGTDLIKFVARDTDGRTSNVATLSINVNYVAPPPANRPPVAGDTSINTFTGVEVFKNLLGSDPDGDPLTFHIVGNAKYGTSRIEYTNSGQAQLVYKSLGKYFGPDKVTYVVVDDKGRTSNVATVSINFINRPPNATDTSLTVASGGSASKFLFGSDPDQNDITFKQVNGARNGTSEVKLDSDGKPRVFYQSKPGYVGPDTVTFVTIDSFGRTSALATVTITVVRASAIGASAATTGAGSGGSS